MDPNGQAGGAKARAVRAQPCSPLHPSPSVLDPNQREWILLDQKFPPGCTSASPRPWAMGSTWQLGREASLLSSDAQGGFLVLSALGLLPEEGGAPRCCVCEGGSWKRRHPWPRQTFLSCGEPFPITFKGGQSQRFQGVGGSCPVAPVSKGR